MQLFGVLGLRCRSNVRRGRPAKPETGDKSERENYGKPTQSREGLLRSPSEREFSKYLHRGRVQSADNLRIIRSGAVTRRWNPLTIKCFQM